MNNKRVSFTTKTFTSLKKIIMLFILLLPMVTSVGYINANVGSITEINIHVVQTITPTECFNAGESCVRNLLCQATECIKIGEYIYINWIW